MPYNGALAAIISDQLGDALIRKSPLLELGCGLSTLASQMRADGWSNVTSCDISAAAVRLAKGRGDDAVRYVVADARHLDRSFGARSFGAVLDKGTLDAICCGEGWDYEARLVAQGIARVLVPGGVWLCVSLMPPDALLPVVHSAAAWDSLVAEPIGSGLHLYTGRTVATPAQ